MQMLTVITTVFNNLSPTASQSKLCQTMSYYVLQKIFTKTKVPYLRSGSVGYYL